MQKFLHKHWRHIIIYICILLFGVLFIIIFDDSAKEVYNDMFFKKAGEENGDYYEYEVRVQRVQGKYEDYDEDGNYLEIYILTCKVLVGNEEDVGKTIKVIQVMIDSIKGKTIKAKVNDIIYVTRFQNNYPIPPGFSDITHFFYGAAPSFSRTTGIIIMVVLFALLIILFSWFQGINTILSLVFTLASIFLVLIPKILTEHNIYVWTFIVSMYIVAITLLLVIGFNKKSLCALAGCLGGIIIIAILTLIVRKVLHMTGNYDDNTYELRFLLGQKDYAIDLQALIFASVTLGSIGALLDVAISLSSSLHEVSLKDNSKKGIIKSGFVIGRDMLGTMSNTLVLAYLGGSLAMVLFTIMYYTFESIMRLEVVAIEISQAIIGTIGMLLAIPITTLVSALIYSKTHRDKKI